MPEGVCQEGSESGVEGKGQLRRKVWESVMGEEKDKVRILLCLCSSMLGFRGGVIWTMVKVPRG